MPIIVVCPACNSKMKAADNLVGKMVKCPSCGKAVTVQAPAAPAPPPVPKQAVRQAPPPSLRPEPVEEVEPEEQVVAAIKANNGEWFEYRTLFRVIK